MIRLLGMAATVVWVKVSRWVDWDGENADIEALRAENRRLRQQLAEARIIDAARARTLNEAWRKGMLS